MFEKGQRVVKLIEGMGTETASIQEVAKINKKKNIVWIGDDYHEDDGVNAYFLDSGRAVANYIGGFRSRIVTLEE